MARTSLGDVFEARNDDQFRYFQLAAHDLYQLNSDVIAVYDGIYDSSQQIDTFEDARTEFFAHTTVRFGIPEYWKKIGRLPLVSVAEALFKDIDHDKEKQFYQPFEGPSSHWKTWDLGENEVYIGVHENMPERAELGLVFSPDSAHYRMFHGQYDFENGYYRVNR